MAPVSGINPQVLVWARETSGQSVSQVANALKRDPAEIEAWEAGSAAPTYPQLETLAYRVYRRPVAIFFFPEPPEEEDPRHSFRTLPDIEIRELEADTRFRIRQARALQLWLYEFHEGENPAERKIFIDLAVGPSKLPNPASLAAEARKYLGVSSELQLSGWKNAYEALRGWRDAIEDCGIYAFKNSFKQTDVSGFCLHDQTFPIIYVNNSTAQTRQIFTLLHELAHLLVGVSGVTKRYDNFIDSLSGSERAIEVFCNRFAAEALLPSETFDKGLTQAAVDDNFIADAAKAFKVSRQVVAIRLRQLGRISQAYYEQKAQEWSQEYEAAQGKEGGGGNYYLTQGSYLGERFLKLAFQRYYQGAVSIESLAEALNVRVSSLPGLENLIFQHPQT